MIFSGQAGNLSEIQPVFLTVRQSYEILSVTEKCQRQQ
jgi:hypothetical protein